MSKDKILTPEDEIIRDDFKLRIQDLYTKPTVEKVMKELSLFATELKRAEDEIRKHTTLIATGLISEVNIEFQSPYDCADETSWINARMIRSGLQAMQDRIDGKPLPDVSSGSGWVSNDVGVERSDVFNTLVTVYYLAHCAISEEANKLWGSYEKFVNAQIEEWYGKDII